ncbi:MAG: winged helix-turn-helix domain-containing protein [Verrucomicrobiales bacterium]|nr:winged helix-turn-helix domain-containing protein [Verrucomicrobiales bacterium]
MPRVAHLIGERFHPGHEWHLLRSLGMSCQQPTRRAFERNETKITEWKMRLWLAIKKALRGSHGRLYRRKRPECAPAPGHRVAKCRSFKRRSTGRSSR